MRNSPHLARSSIHKSGMRYNIFLKLTDRLSRAWLVQGLGQARARRPQLMSTLGVFTHINPQENIISLRYGTITSIRLFSNYTNSGRKARRFHICRVNWTFWASGLIPMMRLK